MGVLKLWDKLFGGKVITNPSYNLKVAPTTPSYQLETMEVNDVSTTRGLYHNWLNNYALAAYLCKPIINSNVSFIGQPILTSESEDTADFLESLEPAYHDIHKMAERDGDCFVWVQIDPKTLEISFVIVPPEKVTKRFIDPIKKIVTGYQIEEHIYYNNVRTGDREDVKIKVIVTPTKTVTYQTGPNVRNPRISRRNPLGVLPIVQFSNEREVFEERGHSEYQNILPQLKFYHDTTFDAGHAQHTDGHPKISVSGVSDFGTWIQNNFGAEGLEDVKAGKSISMDQKDLFVNGQEEDVKYLQRGTPTGDYKSMSEIQFTSIVEGSETPEVNFGASMGTSLASVKEQRPVWVKKIERKQGQYTKPWEQVFKIAIQIYNTVTFSNISDQFNIIWPKPDFKNELDNAEIIERMSRALQVLSDKRLISRKEIYNTLKELRFLQLAASLEEHENEINTEKPPEGTNNDGGTENEDDTETT